MHIVIRQFPMTSTPNMGCGGFEQLSLNMQAQVVCAGLEFQMLLTSA
jgi:hypothetical protein